MTSIRGSLSIITAIASVACVFGATAAAAFGDADDQLFNSSGSGNVALRDVTNSTPKNQPDAGEFVNSGNIELVTSKGTIICTEEEFGTTVLNNKLGTPELALPWGVAEGDECKLGTSNIPTYFDTLNNGAVGNQATSTVASISIADSGTGTKIVATVHNLKFSQKLPVIGFCEGNVDGATGEVTNVTSGFVEEKSPNLNVQFTKAKITIAGEASCPKEGELTGNFFLETPSTETDTAFFKS